MGLRRVLAQDISEGVLFVREWCRKYTLRSIDILDTYFPFSNTRIISPIDKKKYLTTYVRGNVNRNVRSLEYYVFCMM